MVTVEQLYKDFGVLADAKDKAGEHEKSYQSILSATKSGTSEKRLAAQFIPRFFKYFPALSEVAIDSQMDLVEDEDASIRKQAIKDLPLFCKENKDALPKIASLLAQLLSSQDTGELAITHNAIMSLLKTDPKVVLKGIFDEINSEEESNRESAIKFLTTKLKQIPADVMVKDVEDFVIAECKKVLQDVTGTEFVLLMKMLSSMATMTTMQGRKELVEIVVEQAELDGPFEASDADNVDRLSQCIRQALPFFSKNVHSTKFVMYMCDNVLPVLTQIEKSPGDEAGEEVDVQLDVLKLYAELSCHCEHVENIEAKVGKLYSLLLEYMPLPPSDEDGENKTPDEGLQLQFSYVECLMYAFHQLARKCPDFLAGETNADRLKDFRIRLQYFARGVQVYIKQLRAALHGKTGDALKTNENKIKVVALKITNNINVLIKDLFHNPPSYKSAVSLSWKPVSKAAAPTIVSPGQKRPGITPIKFDEGTNGKKAHLGPKSPREIYTPPTGKWSDSAGTYTAPTRGRGFRGRFRGRGRGNRGWRGNRY